MRVLHIAVLGFAALASCTRKELVTFPPQPVTIPDSVFLAYCLTATDMEGNLRIDADGDGVITRPEAAAVEEIYLDNEGGEKVGEAPVPGVQSLAGIEYFTGLRRLSVGNNTITALDLSRNRQLTYLNCSDNPLNSLYLPADSRLETFNCNGVGLATLDVSALSLLKYLYCTGNRLTQLHIGDNRTLVELSCDRNSLETLDVGGCSALTDLSCAGNGLTSIVLPRESSLVRLDCGTSERNGATTENELEELDLSGQDKLSLLRANVNPLTSLDISPCTSLRTLECVGCALGELDITANGRLRVLVCNLNPDGMKIYVPAGFNPSGFLSWVIGTATVVEKSEPSGALN